MHRDLYGASSVGMLQPVSHLVCALLASIGICQLHLLLFSVLVRRVTGVLLLLLPSSVAVIIVYAYAIFTL
jgi:hypothetical protein